MATAPFVLPSVSSPVVSSITAPQLRQALERDPPPLVIDVRREPAYRQSAVRIAGACWRDPSRVAAWLPLLPPGRDVVVYCVHGHEVSQGVAATIGAIRPASFLVGGIEDGWIPAGGSLDPKPRDAEARP